MSMQGFVLVEAFGAALLALWLVVRYPESGPASLRGASLRILASMLLGWALAPITTLVVGSALPAAAFVAALLVVLPGFVYIFLTWAWMVKILQGALGSSHR